MRKFHAFTLLDWPKRKDGTIILRSTNEAFYYAQITDDHVAVIDLFTKLRRNCYQDIRRLKSLKPVNFNRIFDLSVRAQFYRETMEEIKRLNEVEP